MKYCYIPSNFDVKECPTKFICQQFCLFVGIIKLAWSMGDQTMELCCTDARHWLTDKCTPMFVTHVRANGRRINARLLWKTYMDYGFKLICVVVLNVMPLCIFNRFLKPAQYFMNKLGNKIKYFCFRGYFNVWELNRQLSAIFICGPGWHITFYLQFWCLGISWES